MIAVVVIGLMLPVLWCAMWAPIMISIAWRYDVSRAIAIPLVVLGPVGALIGILIGLKGHR